MSDHNTITPDRPLNWRMDYSDSHNCTTLDGTHWTQKDNKSDLWKQFIDRFRSIQYRDVTGQSQGIGDRLSEHGEMILKEKEDQL